MGSFSHWISLILRRFGRQGTMGGDDKPLEAVAIPTVTMIADWAKNDRDDICQIWVFGSAISHDDWDSLRDDLDILLVVSDDKWTHETSRNLPREVPLSKHYLTIDVRVCKESTYDACMRDLKGLAPSNDNEENHYPAIIAYALKTGVCVWKRES